MLLGPFICLPTDREMNETRSTTRRCIHYSVFLTTVTSPPSPTAGFLGAPATSSSGED
jgi:hypothetical protein